MNQIDMIAHTARALDAALAARGAARDAQAERGLAQARALLEDAAAGRPAALARTIDHTLLRPEATPAQVELLCAEARAHQFASVCVNPSYVPLCARLLEGAGVAVCTVVGFPLGATTSAAKVFETAEAAQAGAREIDMVLAVGRLKAGERDAVERDIAQVAAAAHAGGAICKVIIETALLTDAEKEAACALALRARADFVKTSTGFAAGGASAQDVLLMRAAVGQSAGVKASGGIRSLADALLMIAAGASRIGASAGVRIMAEARGESAGGSTSTY